MILLYVIESSLDDLDSFVDKINSQIEELDNVSVLDCIYIPMVDKFTMFVGNIQSSAESKHYWTSSY
jgi:hypothetical protein